MYYAIVYLHGLSRISLLRNYIKKLLVPFIYIRKLMIKNKYNILSYNNVLYTSPNNNQLYIGV